jgi:glycosyltransferase involved in cell wall biosynthesis
MKIPKVSVIMPVYNGEKFLRDAVESILNQTFSDFELIVINDGSSDSSVQIITSYTDPRIVFINNDSNMGLPYVRNQGVDVSRGEYIAWLDCDDTSMLDRLEKQERLLDENPQIGVCGAWVKIIGGGSEIIAQYPSDPEYVRASLLFNNCLANSTVMMRAACTRDIGLRFDPSHHLSQDYGLWVRIPRPWQITNLPEVLTIYRLHENQVTEVHKQKQLDISWQIQKWRLLELGILPTEKERILHMSLSGFIQNTFEDPDKLFEASDYLIKLDNLNHKYKIYDKKNFREVLWGKWVGASRSWSSSGRLMLRSARMRLRFGTLKPDLPGRVVKKLARIIVKALQILRIGRSQ